VGRTARPAEPTSAEIRELLHRRLVLPRRAGEPVRVVDELAVGGVNVGCRVADVARIGDALWGWEVKGHGDGDRDRLQGQAEAYGAVFERCSLVATRRLAQRALELLPAWWEVLTVHRTAGGRLVIRRLRAGAPNPEPPADVERLLWGSEVSTLLRSVGCPYAIREKCGTWVARACLDAVLTPEARLAAVRHCLRQRTWSALRANTPLPTAADGDEARDLAILAAGTTAPAAAADWVSIVERLPHWDRPGWDWARRRLYFDLPRAIREQPGMAERLLGDDAPLYVRRQPPPHPVFEQPTLFDALAGRG
jgi:hypothetical protein